MFFMPPPPSSLVARSLEEAEVEDVVELKLSPRDSPLEAASQSSADEGGKSAATSSSSRPFSESFHNCSLLAVATMVSADMTSEYEPTPRSASESPMSRGWGEEARLRFNFLSCSAPVWERWRSSLITAAVYTRPFALARSSAVRDELATQAVRFAPSSTRRTSMPQRPNKAALWHGCHPPPLYRPTSAPYWTRSSTI